MGLIRLIALLGLLCAGFWAVMTMPGAEPDRAPAVAAPQPSGNGNAVATAARADTASETRALPAAVRRLADQPVTGPVRPTILAEPVIDPAAVQPMAPVRKAVAEAAASGEGTIRRVGAYRVNVRGGPSTSFPVVGGLAQNEEVTVLEADASGWVRVRIEGDGIEGWISGRLLAP